jgi:ABC-type phosphate transport system substrate-binding protein
MLPSEIEMFRPRAPTGYVARSIRICIISLAIAALSTATTVQAAAPTVPLFADRDLGDALAQAIEGAGSDARHVEVAPAAVRAACTAAAGSTPRLALLTRVPSRIELDACGDAAAADVSTLAIGRQAVALVAPASSPVWSISAAALFRAIGQNSDAKPPPATWSDIDPAYPHLPIGLLMPASDSRAQRLFDTLIIARGCDNAGGERIPFDLKSRARFCGVLRSDIPVLQRQGGAQDVANWAASAPSGQIAIVTIGELRELDRRVVPLLIDGALPTAANIANGRYPAAEQVQLLIVVPHAADPAQRTAARALAFNLLAETTIGPTGSLAPAGLIPLPPSERIAARSQAVASLEQP